MKTIGCTAEEAEAALLTLARHVAVGVELGRPMVAWRDDDGAVTLLTDLTDLTWWWVYGSEVERVLPLSDDRVELTVYRHGVEVSRRIVG